MHKSPLEAAELADAHTPSINKLSHEAEAAFTRERKLRHRRLLQNRWQCRVNGHRYCFFNNLQLHIQLTDTDLDEWADNMVSRVCTCETGVWITFNSMMHMQLWTSHQIALYLHHLATAIQTQLLFILQALTAPRFITEPSAGTSIQVWLISDPGEITCLHAVTIHLHNHCLILDPGIYQAKLYIGLVKRY